MSRHTPYPQDGQPKRAAPGPVLNDGWKRSVLLAGLLLFLALAYAAARDAHGATYKWVDEKGIIHYSDKMPPDAVNRAHVELDRQGRQFKKVDPALTADEVRARPRMLSGKSKKRKSRKCWPGAIARCSRRIRARKTWMLRACGR